jgi:hypothetical protein
MYLILKEKLYFLSFTEFCCFVAWYFFWKLHGKCLFKLWRLELKKWSEFFPFFLYIMYMTFSILQCRNPFCVYVLLSHTSSFKLLLTDPKLFEWLNSMLRCNTTKYGYQSKRMYGKVVRWDKKKCYVWDISNWLWCLVLSTLIGDGQNQSYLYLGTLTPFKLKVRSYISSMYFSWKYCLHGFRKDLHSLHHYISNTLMTI